MSTRPPTIHHLSAHLVPLSHSAHLSSALSCTLDHPSIAHAVAQVASDESAPFVIPFSHGILEMNIAVIRYSRNPGKISLEIILSPLVS